MSKYEFFTERELMCSCGCGLALMDDVFMEKVVKLRRACNFPFKVSSAFRCPEHNTEVGGVPSSHHLTGKAMDLLVRGERALEIVTLAPLFGMKGIGVSQKGALRFIHIDDAGHDIRFWSY